MAHDELAVSIFRPFDPSRKTSGGHAGLLCKILLLLQDFPGFLDPSCHGINAAEP